MNDFEMKNYIVVIQGTTYYYQNSRTRYVIVTASSEEAAKIRAGAKLWNLYRECIEKIVSISIYPEV